jgi:hypothetical protein
VLRYGPGVADQRKPVKYDSRDEELQVGQEIMWTVGLGG